MKYCATIVIVNLLVVVYIHAAADTTYQVEITITESPIISTFRTSRIPGTENTAALGYGSFARCMWHPDHLLSVGITSGYLFLASDEVYTADQFTSDTPIPRARLTAIQMQIALSMQKENFEIGIGVGPYLLLSRLTDRNGIIANGRRYEFGITSFASYVFLVSERIFIGPEFRVIYLGYRGIVSYLPSFTVRFDVLRY